MPVQFLEINRGSEQALPVEWENDNGQAVGATISAGIRKILTHEIIIGDATISWSDESLGQATLRLSESETDLLPLGRVSEIFIKIVKTGVITEVFSAGEIRAL